MDKVVGRQATQPMHLPPFQILNVCASLRLSLWVLSLGAQRQEQACFSAISGCMVAQGVPEGWGGFSTVVVGEEPKIHVPDSVRTAALARTAALHPHSAEVNDGDL